MVSAGLSRASHYRQHVASYIGGALATLLALYGVLPQSNGVNYAAKMPWILSAGSFEAMQLSWEFVRPI